MLLSPISLLKAASAGGPIQAGNINGSAYLKSPDNPGYPSDSAQVTLAIAFQTPGSWNEVNSYVLFDTDYSQWSLILGSGATKTLTWTFKNASQTIVWQGTTTTTFATGTKYSFAVSYIDGSRAQLYVNKSSETIVSETDNGGTIDLQRTNIYVGARENTSDIFGGIISHFWVDDVSSDLASAISNYFDSSNDPIDAQNGAAIFMNWGDLVDDGDWGGAWNTPNGAPSIGNW